MAKATVSATDFIKAVTGEAQPFDVPGVGTVLIRALTFAEAERITSAHKDNTAEMMLQAMVTGLVEPKFSAEEVTALRTSSAGPVMRIAARIMQLSGMTDTVALEGEAGGGS